MKETPKMDRISKSARSRVMSRVRAKNTAPERLVRSIAHRLGFRFRLYGRQLPGTPDLVFSSRCKVIFVHGCFWHQHACRLGQRLPATNREYWLPKLKRNKERDIRNVRLLRSKGWSVLIIWECQTKDLRSLSKKINRFLER